MGKAKPVALGALQFQRKGDALMHLQAMLQRYAPGQRVADADAEVLRAALKRHPDAAEKIGAGVDHFVVRSAEYHTQCFWVIRADGTTERFSYKSCV